MPKIDVIVHGDKQWDFEPQVHDKEHFTLLTSNLRRLPPCPGGATLEMDGEVLGTVEKTFPRGTAFVIVYKPPVLDVEVEMAKLELEAARLELEAADLEVEAVMLELEAAGLDPEEAEPEPVPDEEVEEPPTSERFETGLGPPETGGLATDGDI